MDRCLDCEGAFPCTEFLGGGIPDALCLACNHAKSRHQPAAPALPPKGGCSATGCTRFTSPVNVVVTGNTKCTSPIISAMARPGTICDAPYRAHSSGAREVQVAPVRSGDRMASWTPPSQVAQLATTDQRRVQHYRSHATPSVGVKKTNTARMPRGSFLDKQHPTVDLAIFPEAYKFDVDTIDSDVMDYRPPAEQPGFKILDDRMLFLVPEWMKNNLVFRVEIHGDNLSERITETIRTNLHHHHGIELRNGEPEGPDRRGWVQMWGDNPKGVAPRRYVVLRASLPDNWWTSKNILTRATKNMNAIGLSHPILFIGLPYGPLLFHGHPCVGPKLMMKANLPRHLVPGDNGDQPAQLDCLRECPAAKDPRMLVHFKYPPMESTNETNEAMVHPAPRSGTSGDTPFSFATIPPSASSAPSPTPSSFCRTFNDKANLSDDDDRAIEAGFLPKHSVKHHQLSNESDDEEALVRAAIQASLVTHRNEQALREGQTSAGAGPSSAGPRDCKSASSSRISGTVLGDSTCNATGREPARRRLDIRSEATNLPPGYNIPSSPQELSSAIERLVRAQRAVGDAIEVTSLTDEVTTDEAANAFVAAIIARASHLPLPQSPGVSIAFPAGSNWALAPLHVSLPNTVGISVPRVFLSATVEKMMQHSDVWQQHGEGFYLLKTSHIETPSLVAKFRGFGVICALALIHLEVIPAEICPALFEAILHGVDSVNDEDWLGQFLTGLVVPGLRAWPMELEEMESSPIMSQLLAELDMQPNQLNLPEYRTLEMRKNVRLQLVAKLVLGVASLQGSFKDHYAVKAFVSGFNQLLSPRYQTSLLDLLDRNSKHLLLSLHAQFPKSGECVRPYIDWIESGSADLLEHEERFKSHFFRYLNGVGHINNPALNRQLSEDEVKGRKDDAGLRARLFLRYVTGKERLPWRTEKIQISFRVKATTEKQKNSQAKMPPPIEVHTCYSQAIIPLHEYLLGLLAGPEEDAIWFDVYLHLTFVDNSFNIV
ncbi:hypothetical protein PQX77_014218 [Marasmius sp. AFHP31]|nr:hypothetical protein PQX77_014218 [Marasmius sp. AFHP31]